MSNFVPGARHLLQSVCLAALVSGCAVTPQPLTPDQLSQQGAEDTARMFQGGEVLTRPLTVSDALARALKYNLDRRTKVMEEALALEQTELDSFDLLPKVVANAGYAGRSRPNATRSRDLYTQSTSTSNPTYSADRDARTADLGASWNILDFGVSYYTAHQNADRALIATERRRKAVQSVVSEVRFAFWRAAAHQELKDDVERAVADARLALERAKTVERENLKAPTEFLRYRKSLLETMRQLTAIQQELSTAQIELAALIDLPPGAELKLVVPAELRVPDWKIGLERMEELAFLNNTDLREQGYLSRIAVDDTKKAILKLLPGITFSGGRNYDHNSFMVDHVWNEAGAKLSWNLINVISGPTSIKFAKLNERVTGDRRVALRMAVLAQVHVSERQFRNSSSQFLQSDELWLVDKRLADLSDAKSANDAQGMLERVAGHTSAIASQLRRFQTYAQLEQSFSKMQATLGEDLLPDQLAASDLETLSRVIAGRLTDWDKGEVEGRPSAQPAVFETTATSSHAMGENAREWLGNVADWFRKGLEAPEPVLTPHGESASPNVSSRPKAAALQEIALVEKREPVVRGGSGKRSQRW